MTALIDTDLASIVTRQKMPINFVHAAPRSLLPTIFFAACLLLCAAYASEPSRESPQAVDCFTGKELLLAKAVENCDLDEVRRLAAITDLNKIGNKGISMLHFAVFKARDNYTQCQFDIITELIKAGADPKLVSEKTDIYIAEGKSLKEGYTSTRLALLLSDASPLILKAMLDGGLQANDEVLLDRNVMTSGGMIRSILWDKNIEAVKQLIAYGADINKINKFGNNALADTSIFQRKLLKVLLEAGGNPDMPGRFGRTVSNAIYDELERDDLDKAPEYKKECEEIAALIRAKGFPWPPLSMNEQRVRMRAAGEKDIPDPTPESWINKKLSSKFPASEYFQSRQLPLAEAVEKGDLEAVQRLTGQSDVNSPGKDGMSLLHFAVLHTKKRSTEPRLDIITALVRAGADYRQAAPIPEHLAKEFKNKDPYTPLYMAIKEYASPALLQAMLDGGMPADAYLESSNWPIIFDIISGGIIEQLRVLLQYMPADEVNKKSSGGQTPLRWAGHAPNNTQAMVMLLDAGGNPEIPDDRGHTLTNAMYDDCVTHKGCNQDFLQYFVERFQKLNCTWPPLSPVEQRDRMRERGETPKVPPGESR